MSRYHGDQNQVVFLHESGTYAATSGTGQWLGLVQELNFDEEENIEDIRFAGNAKRDVGQFVAGGRDITGTLRYYPQDWRLLGYALGSIVDGGSPSPYTHTLSSVNSNQGNGYTSGIMNPFLSFTLEDSKTAIGTGTNNVRTAVGCMINSWEMSWREKDIVECNVELIAQQVNFSSGTKTAVTESTTRPFVSYDVLLHLPSGTVINEMKEGSLRISNDMQPAHYNNGSRVTDVPIPGDRMIELPITVDSTSERYKTLYDQYYRGGSSFNCILAVIDNSAGAGSRDVAITMSGCRIVDMEDPNQVSGVNKNQLTIRPQTVVASVNDTIFRYNPW